MAYYLIIKASALPTGNNKIRTAGTNPAIWLWDDTNPNERTFVSGDNPAYVTGDRVMFLDGRPQANEFAFRKVAT